MNSTMSKSRRLHGKVALITGAASGIGKETTRLFATNGAFVVVPDINDELGQEVVTSIGINQASFHHCDVRDEKQVEEIVNYTVEKHGRLDILFSNAGIFGPCISSILTLDMSNYDDIMATNVRGVVMTIKYASRVMVERKIRGSIICTASVASVLVGAPLAYTSSKHAVLGVVRSSCMELGAHGIRVNSVSPHGVATPLACRGMNLEESEAEEIICSSTSLKGVVLKASHIAEAVLFLASDESTFISGQNLVIDGGFVVVKSLM